MIHKNTYTGLCFWKKNVCVWERRWGGGQHLTLMFAMCAQPPSRVQLFSTLWTIAPQAPLSMGFSRQEYWSGLPCPPPGELPNPGINPRLLRLLHWQAGSLPLVPPGKPHLNTDNISFSPVGGIGGIRKVESSEFLYIWFSDKEISETLWPGMFQNS